jgi:hypothetical protein
MNPVLDIPIASPERWVNKRELAAHLRYSTRWVEQQHHLGLPSEMFGGQRRYRISEVESWLKTNND